ncbi:hypothetical protein DM860_014019 [Cuscuta australis]|uniref:Uncharacterized protein n=1 Tax=Cuscuta australis TaxID=267555 RepID=A0A328DN71_9ASTE|nr:hypothetical protein DM860_014019 [Cuscuta australis]
MYIAIPAEMLGIILPLLLGVAFLLIVEHKVMAFVQYRKGLDVVGSFGLLQPIAEGVYGSIIEGNPGNEELRANLGGR